MKQRDKKYYFIGDVIMWVITVYLNSSNIKMFDFETEKEAREAFEKIQGCKILSEVVYFNDSCLAAV